MSILFEDYWKDYHDNSTYCNDLFNYYHLKDNYFRIIDKCLTNGEFDRFKDCIVYMNCLNLCATDKVTDNILNLKVKLENSVNFPFELEELLCMRKLYFQYKSKQRRLRDFIKYLFSKYDNLVFVTFTFTDDVLKNTTTFTRRKYVSRYLKCNCSEYCANVDFGLKFKREHFHGIATADLDLSKWKYGLINVKRITSKNVGKLSKYIDKLTSHALKSVTGLRSNIIYSRSRSSISVDGVF